MVTEQFDFSGLKVAIVHDWLTNLGGAERVIVEMLKVFPQADLYTSVYNPDKLTLFSGRNVKTSFLQRLPLASRKHQLFPILRRYAFESFDLSGYDLVISSSTAEAKGIITPESCLHIGYIHTPTRYYWSHYQEYLDNPGFGFLDPLVRLQLKASIASARRWDFAAAQRPDILLANSHTVSKRIATYYKRSSEVVYPPVQIKRFAQQHHRRPQNVPEKYFVVASRLIPYKRFDLAVAAATRNKQALVVVGDGSQRKQLEEMAGPTVQFIGAVSDSILEAYIQHAEALIFPAEEDFGIVPVEAMAAGVPVIAYGKGGVSETVIDGETGKLTDRQTLDAFAATMRDFSRDDYDSAVISRHATSFSEQKFRDHLSTIVKQHLRTA